MKDIEKLFEQKLKNHQVTPPAGSWEKLNRQLYTTPKRSLAFYSKVAASVLLLVAAAVIVYLYLNKTAAPVAPDIAVEQKIQPITPEADQPLAEETEEPIPLAQHPMTKKDHQNAAQQAFEQKNEDYAIQKSFAKVSKIASQSYQELALESKATPYAVLDVTSTDALPRYQPVTIVYRDAKPEKPFGLFSYLKSANISLAELRQTKDELIDKAFSSF